MRSAGIGKRGTPAGTCAPTFSCVPFGRVAEAVAGASCCAKYCWIVPSVAVLPVDALELLLVVPTLGGVGGGTVATGAGAVPTLGVGVP